MPTAETTLNTDTKIQILRTLSLNDKSYSSADLEEATTKDITSIYKALEDLRKENVLKIIQTEGKTKYYKIGENQVNLKGLDRDYEMGYPQEISQLLKLEAIQYSLGELPPYPLNIVFDFRKKLINQIEGIKTIILFGSAARGEYTLESDLDLYIVCENDKENVESRVFKIAEKYNHEFSLEVKTVEQYEEDFSKPLSKLADSMIKDGYTVLYGDGKKPKQYIEEPIEKSKLGGSE